MHRPFVGWRRALTRMRILLSVSGGDAEGAAAAGVRRRGWHPESRGNAPEVSSVQIPISAHRQDSIVKTILPKAGCEE